MYRTIHNVLAQTAGDWFLEHLPLPPSGKPYAKTLRVPMATSKIWQINALTQSLAQEAGKATYNASLPAVPAFTVFDLAKVTQAYTGDCRQSPCDVLLPKHTKGTFLLQSRISFIRKALVWFFTPRCFSTTCGSIWLDLLIMIYRVNIIFNL